MPRALALLVLLVLAGCRSLLGIEEGVVGDTGPDDALVDDAPDGPCSTAGCACETNVDCVSAVCVSGETCADPSNVAYVVEGGTGSACLSSDPCGTLTEGIASGKPYVRIHGAVREPAMVVISSSRGIYGSDPLVSSVTHTGGGPVISVPDGSSLEVYDLGIHGGQGPGAHGIVMSEAANANVSVVGCHIWGNEGVGISTEGGTLIVDRTTIANNVQGGIEVNDSTFTITSSILVQNGSTISNVGGARLEARGVSRFEFNTIYDNVSMLAAGQPMGLTCMSSFTVENNILAGRLMNCSPRYSLTEGLQGNTTNVTGSPAFVQTTARGVPGYYRIGATSAAIGRANPAATITTDIDGQSRTIGDSDIGADEYVP